MKTTSRDIPSGVAPRAVLVTAALCAALFPGRVQAQALWELTPYQFHVYLAVQTCAELPPPAADQLGAELVRLVEDHVGGAWNLTVSHSEAALRQCMLADLEGIGVGAMPEDCLKNDKVTLATIVPQAAGFRIAARELDVRTRRFSALVEKDVPQAALLSQSLFVAVLEAFAPLASMQAGEGDQVVLRLRAGRLAARDPSLLAVQPGAVFCPIIRTDDRDGKPKKIVSLPWSYLAVEQVEESQLTCRMYSGVRVALSGRRRGRVQELALAVKPAAKPTRLTIRARSGSNQPLAGYDVFRQKPGEKTTEWIGRTDVAGQILIRPAWPGLQVICIRNGGQMLARFPLVPGVEESVDAAVIDDDPRLAAEAVVMAAEEDLVDLVTRRAVLSARISAAIAAGKVDEADQFLLQLYALRTRDQFAQQLDQQRQRLASQDPVIQQQVATMFDKIRSLVLQHLDPDEVDKLGDQVRAAKEAAVSRPKS